MPSTVILCGLPGLFLLYLRIIRMRVIRNGLFIGSLVGDGHCGDPLLFRDHGLFGDLRSRIFGAYLRILQRPRFLRYGLDGFFGLYNLIIIDSQQTLRIGDVF